MTAEVVFLLDVDNTLLDNDRIIVDLRRHLEREFGLASARAGCHCAPRYARPDGDPLGWRCRVPAAQDTAVRPVGRCRRPGADLRPQGADARGGAASLPRAPLRHG